MLTDYGKPIAVISPIEQTSKAESGSGAGKSARPCSHSSRLRRPSDEFPRASRRASPLVAAKMTPEQIAEAQRRLPPVKRAGACPPGSPRKST